MKKKNCKLGIVFAVAALVVAVLADAYSNRKLSESGGGMPSAECGSCALEGVVSNRENAVSVEQLEESRRREIGRIRNARRELAASFQEDLKQEHEAFRRQVDERAACFDAVKDGIHDVVSQYGYEKCWSVMAALAKDKVAEKLGSGCTTNFDRIMNDDLRIGFYCPLLTAREEVVALLPEYVGRVEACRRKFAEKLNRIPEWDRSLGDIPKSLQADSLRIEKAMQRLMAAQIGSTVSAAFDAVGLACVYRTMASLLSGAAARLAASAVAGGSISILDTPAPGPMDVVGFAVFGAGAAITAWEVRKAIEVIPDELSQIMNDTVDRQRQETLTRLLEEGEELFMSYSRAFVFKTGAGK